MCACPCVTSSNRISSSGCVGTFELPFFLQAIGLTADVEAEKLIRRTFWRSTLFFHIFLPQSFYIILSLKILHSGVLYHDFQLRTSLTRFSSSDWQEKVTEDKCRPLPDLPCPVEWVWCLSRPMGPTRVPGLCHIWPRVNTCSSLNWGRHPATTIISHIQEECLTGTMLVMWQSVHDHVATNVIIHH
jgi:hypothetical protein